MNIDGDFFSLLLNSVKIEPNHFFSNSRIVRGLLNENSKGVIPYKNQIKIINALKKQISMIWKRGFVQDVFFRKMKTYHTQIEALENKQRLLQKFARFVERAQKKTPKFSDVEHIDLLHNRFYVGVNFQRIIDLQYEKIEMEDFEDKYDQYYENYSYYEENYYDENYDENYNDDFEYNYTSKQKKQKHKNLYELALCEINSELAKFSCGVIIYEKDVYCAHSICAFLNSKTTGDWGIFGKIMEFL